MADGMFDSGGGHSSGGLDPGGPSTSVGHSSIAVSDAEAHTGWIVGLLAVAFVLTVGVALYGYRSTQLELARERVLDGTVYAEQARAHLEAWLATREYDVVEGSVWMEDGSSHRATGQGGDYHCKGGQFQARNAGEITFCCAVQPEAHPPCLVIQP